MTTKNDTAITRSDRNNAHAGIRKSWTRAHLLAKAAKGTPGADQVTQARTYISNHPEAHDALDKGQDLKSIVADYAQWYRDNNPTHTSAGLNLDVLFELRDVQKKYNLTYDELIEGIETLKYLTDES